MLKRLRLVLMLLLAGFALPLLAQTHTDGAPPILEGPQPVAPSSATSAGTMTDDTVVRMHTAGLADALIIQTIAAQPGTYKTDPDSLIALKQAGLSDAVLDAMAEKSRTRITHTDQPITLSPVNEPGLYYKDGRGQWIMMDSEVVHVVSGGFLKSTFTNGIIKPDRNGSVTGRQSSLLLPRPIDFLIYTPDGVSASEYDLLRFRLNAKNREFRTLTGGVIHSKGGAQRDELAFKPVKIAPHTWTFSLGQDTPGGEYGILPPGTGNITNGGKIYTFAISE